MSVDDISDGELGLLSALLGSRLGLAVDRDIREALRRQIAAGNMTLTTTSVAVAVKAPHLEIELRR